MKIELQGKKQMVMGQDLRMCKILKIIYLKNGLRKMKKRRKREKIPSMKIYIQL